jgi:hypothetical protein
MLNKINGNRYCKFEQISSHPWFKGFNWNDLISLDMKPGYIPKIENIKVNEKDIQPYLNVVNALKEWKESEKVIVTPLNEKDFIEWFKNF